MQSAAINKKIKKLPRPNKGLNNNNNNNNNNHHHHHHHHHHDNNVFPVLVSSFPDVNI
jgi:hypothetical protein